MCSEAPGRSVRRISASSVPRCGRSGAALIAPWRCTSSSDASSAGMRAGKGSVRRCVQAAGAGAAGSGAGVAAATRRGRRAFTQAAQRGGRPHRVALGDHVLVEDVDLPQRLVGVAHPELGLLRVAALDAVLALGVHPGQLEPALDGDQFLAVPHPEPDVVQVPARGRPARNQREHQRRLGDVELGVVVLDLGRLGTEQHPVERNRPGDVGDVQRSVKLDESCVDRGCHVPSGREMSALKSIRHRARGRDTGTPTTHPAGPLSSGCSRAPRRASPASRPRSWPRGSGGSAARCSTRAR